MDNPFWDDLFEQFMIYDQFFATEVPCPWCSQRFQRDFQTGETDGWYGCRHCHRIFPADREARELRRTSENAASTQSIKDT
jgi:hypothetical protein